jgi:hypothetical protein
VDGAGVQWRVSELPERVTAEVRWPACLIFESEAVVRRLRAYPPHWRDLPDAELDALVNTP